MIIAEKNEIFRELSSMGISSLPLSSKTMFIYIFKTSYIIIAVIVHTMMQLWTTEEKFKYSSNTF